MVSYALLNFDELLFDNVHVTSHFASTQLKNYSPVQIPKVI